MKKISPLPHGVVFFQMKRMLALGPESPGRPERGERGCASEVDRAVVVTQERVVGWYQQTLDGSF